MSAPNYQFINKLYFSVKETNNSVMTTNIYIEL